MSNDAGPHRLDSTYLRLGTDSAIELLPVDENFWPNLISGKLGDFKHEYLVVTSSFDEDWSTWEQHPNGDEFVYLLAGAVDFVLERDGRQDVVELRAPGSFVLVPRGAWHTARVKAPTKMLFITAGEGTQIRPK